MVLIFDQGRAPHAVMTELMARTASEEGDRVRLAGPISFDAKVQRHVIQTLVTLVDAVCDCLRVPRKNFEISGVNLGVASQHDRGLMISGFSADVSIFLAVLGAASGIEVSGSVLATGHIASVQGHVRMVRNLPAKLACALRDPSIRKLVHPATNADASLPDLTPSEADELEGLVRGALDRIECVGIRDIGDLVKAAFDERAIVLGSLRTGWFGTEISASDDSPVGRVVGHFVNRIDERFTALVEAALFAGDSHKVSVLLAAFVDWHVRQRKYPLAFGQQLRSLLAGVPAPVRRLKLEFPLISAEQLRALKELANGTVDFVLLEQASQGLVESRETTSDGKTELDYLLKSLDAATIAAKVEIPIDTARGRFVLEKTVVANRDEFLAIIEAFHHHVTRHVKGIAEPRSNGEAVDLLEQAFCHEGGFAGALTEAQHGGRGGLRYVLDQMAEQYKLKKRQAYVLYRMHKAIDPLDWDQRLAFVRQIQERCGLPEELADQPPESLVKRYQELAAAVFDSLEPVKRLLKSR